MSKKISMDNDGVELLKQRVLADPDMAAMAETLAGESITQLSQEFWEYVWLGVILGQAYQAS